MASDKVVRRRRYSEELKAQVLAECDAPGASVAKVAMAHGINANVVHRWRQLAREGAQRWRQRRTASSCRWRLPAPRLPAPDARHRSRTAPRRGDDEGHLADVGRGRLRGLDARAAAVIRVDAVWLAVEPLDMRAGTEAALARVVARLRRRAPAPRLPLRQPPRQPHEGAGARRHRRVAGRAPAATRASSSGPRTPARR